MNREPTAEEAIEAFRDEGLEVGEVRTVTRSEDRSLIPKTYEEQMSFTIPSSGEVWRVRLHVSVPGGLGSCKRIL